MLSHYKTTVERVAGRYRVVYRNTCIVSWDGDTVTLNSGGWYTATTKRKMNQTSADFDLGFIVFQSKFAWFVTFPPTRETPTRETVPFHDGMTFNQKGE